MKKQNNLNEFDQLHFLKRLQRLLINGYSLVNAFEVMKWDKKMEKTAVILIQQLINGKTVDEAFEKAMFHSTIISYLYFIRINGDLLTSIEKCIHMFEHRYTNINKFKQVIRYPIVLSIFFVILLIFLKTSVLPSFMDIFVSSSESTKTILVSITMIDLMSSILIITLILLLLGTVFWNIYIKNIPIDQRIQFYKNLPIYKGILRLQTSYYFATHMGMFLKTGMSMKDVIYHMKAQKKLPVIAYYAELMMMELKRGIYIDHLLGQLYFIEKQLAVIFQKNNNLANLQQDLTTYADFLTETLEQKIMRMIAMIQPIFFVILASLIIFTYLTLMWPMFQLIKTV